MRTKLKKKYHKFGLGDENKNKWRLHMKKNKKKIKRMKTKVEKTRHDKLGLNDEIKNKSKLY